MDWLRLDDSYQQLVKTHKERSQAAETTGASVKDVNFGSPSEKVIFPSMLLVHKWLRTAGVEIHYRGLEKLRRVDGYRNIMLPNHPSLFDSIALRPLLYLSNEPMPYIAAVDALSKVPMVSSLLKNNGVFFINTKRFSDLAYREKVNDFMRSVTDNGDWLLFFMEGDRSAHERQRVPRRGLLKAMVDKPCMFFPISVSYERIISSYLSGIGKVYVEIHDPVAYHPAEEFSNLVSHLAETVQKGVNAYTTDVAATLLLYYGAGQQRPVPELERDVQWLQATLISREVPFVEGDLEKALQYLGVKTGKGKVRVPADGSVEYLRLVHHRERILHAIYDLADPPNFIAKEFAWTPPAPLINDDRLKAVASSAVAHLVQMYSSIITLLDQGVQTVREIEQAVVTPVINLQMLRNTLRLLQEQKIITVGEKGVITLN
jgi:1-acyl-sn-glycerol-3-phosphate acyltransferase